MCPAPDGAHASSVALPITTRRLAERLAKRKVEADRALVSDELRDGRQGSVCSGQYLGRYLQSTPGQVLRRPLPDELTEGLGEVGSGHPSMPGQRIQGPRSLVLGVYGGKGPADPGMTQSPQRPRVLGEVLQRHPQGKDEDHLERPQGDQLGAGSRRSVSGPRHSRVRISNGSRASMSWLSTITDGRDR